MNSMHIRHFRTGDESALYRIYFSAVHQIAARDYSPEQVNAWAPVEHDKELWGDRMHAIKPLVAELDDEIVGYADLQNSGHINHFFVSGFKPKLGIGSLLMNRILQDAKLLRLEKITADVSKTAESFFTRYDFVVLERRSLVRRGVFLQNAAMHKLL